MTPVNDEKLEEMLRDSAGYLADGGFTERVMGALPARRRPVRPWILLGATVLGALAAFVFAPGGDFLLDSVRRIVAYRLHTPLPIVPVVILSLVALGAATLVTSDA